MPSSGRPTKAALLKMTHGSSAAEVNGRQKVARDVGAPASGALDVAVTGSDDLRFHRRLAETITEVINPTDRRMTAIHIRETVSLAPLRGDGWMAGGGTEGTICGCGGGSTGRGSKIR